jgi:predicted Rossmann fold nucleotide-binding protein DprA/Smf involved in DNA uptake
MTFSSGFKNYYKQIVTGDVLVLSTFYPKSTWKKELAMARNPIIYVLAKEIYVAESSEKGGTWSGVIDGLRKKRIIYVRNPELNEKNANSILIEKGAIAVNFEGKELKSIANNSSENVIKCTDITVEFPNSNNESISFEQMVKEIIGDNSLSLDDISKLLNLGWPIDKLRTRLRKLDF